MPRGGPRGAMRGGAPRGGLGRGSAPRGAPSGRGGPASVSNRGGTAPRSRPPTAGAPRMLPTPAMSHQQGPAVSQPKTEGYEDYVSFPTSAVVVWDVLVENKSWVGKQFSLLQNLLLFWFSNSAPESFYFRLMKSLIQNLVMRDMKTTTHSSQQPRELCVFVCLRPSVLDSECHWNLHPRPQGYRILWLRPRRGPGNDVWKLQ